MNRAQALSKLNRSDMRNAAAERGMQRLFTWNRAHWIGMVVLIAVLLLLQWSSSMYLMPDEVLDRAAKNPVRMVPRYGSALAIGVGNHQLDTRFDTIRQSVFPVGERNHRTTGIRLDQSSLTAGVPIPFLGSRESRNIMKTAISCNDARADPSKGANHERATDGTVPVARTTQMP